MKKTIIIILSAVTCLLVLFSTVFSKECGYCHGDGLQECSICSTSGSIKCTHCKDGYLPCEKCLGSPKSQCSNCHGKGYNSGMDCENCGGDGYHLTLTDLSGALGELYRNPRKQWNGLWAYDCGSCEGTGKEITKCTACYQKGYVLCNTCRGSGNGDVCPNCQGSTSLVCGNCNGEGLYDCAKCKGLGKRFLWN